MTRRSTRNADKAVSSSSNKSTKSVEQQFKDTVAIAKSEASSGRAQPAIRKIATITKTDSSRSPTPQPLSSNTAASHSSSKYRYPNVTPQKPSRSVHFTAPTTRNKRKSTNPFDDHPSYDLPPRANRAGRISKSKGTALRRIASGHALCQIKKRTVAEKKKIASLADVAKRSTEPVMSAPAPESQDNDNQPLADPAPADDAANASKPAVAATSPTDADTVPDDDAASTPKPAVAATAPTNADDATAQPTIPPPAPLIELPAWNSTTALTAKSSVLSGARSIHALLATDGAWTELTREEQLALAAMLPTNPFTGNEPEDQPLPNPMKVAVATDTFRSDAAAFKQHLGHGWLKQAHLEEGQAAHERRMGGGMELEIEEEDEDEEMAENGEVDGDE